MLVILHKDMIGCYKRQKLRWAVEVARRQAKVREGTTHPDLALEAAQTKLQDLKSNVATLGKEAAVAMAAVESQQQRLTLRRLITMMMSERQRNEAATAQSTDNMPATPKYAKVNDESTPPVHDGSAIVMGYFLGEVVCAYQAESDAELNLSIGDYVVVRKVSNNGWAEGECKGKAGWFPFGYIEKRERMLASKVAEVF